jgi:signal transduction histidine kinase
LRTPLTAITGFAELARGLAGTDDPRLVDFLERIEANARQMALRLEGIVALSRLQRSEEPDTVIDLESTLRELLERVQPPATGVLGEETHHVRAPAEMVRKLFRRLVDNCLDHAGRDDVTVSVSISATAEGGVAISVEDDGKGIPAEERATALSPFGQLNGDTAAGKAGMGLTLAERAARILGARFEIGDRLGGGCRVTVTFPPSRVAGTA